MRWHGVVIAMGCGPWHTFKQVTVEIAKSGGNPVQLGKIPNVGWLAGRGS